ncbi:2912_t:CDS:2, partial [Racocetra fulgida]
MSVFDPTKPIYTDHKNIEEFLLYFEAYTASKDWDDGKKSLIIVLHITDKLKLLMMQLMKAHSTWKDLKVAMITKWTTSSDINEKLEHLKNMVQEIGDTVQMYTNCFDNYITEVKDQLRDLEKREWYIQAVKMKKYDRNREYISKSLVQIATEKVSRASKDKTYEIPTAHETKICRVSDQHFLNTERLDRMET